MKNSNKGRQTEIKQENGLIRLNRYIANAGVCSRREADELISSGEIKVNGKVVSDLGTKVSVNDTVYYGKKLLSAEKKIYLLLNKPKDYVTTMDDPHADKIVSDLVKNACPERIYPVGRLDRSTTGLLLFTNDGDLAKKLSHPRYNKKKIYHVFLDKALSKNDLNSLTSGVDIGEEKVIAADAASFVDMDDRTQVGLEIHSGQNRVVRRMFETLGYRVRKLDRVYYAGLTKKNLPRGKWRFLSDNEVKMLKRGSYK
ncbi:MAG: pseudouridine synthase [Marinilabiliaceae bacterium]|jgi:23S rRNA pseudouridine2605 synthase|nr:pseudouridine synthase [Marinilabiliaceae bacterium]